MFDLGNIMYTVPAFLFAISIHEYAHAQCADSLGDPTPRYQGRLTLNPAAHLDLIGGLMLVLFHFGWARPVEYDPRYFRNPREDSMKVALAGPLANLFLCLLAALVLAFMQRLGMLNPGVYKLLRWIMLYNVWFAFFNLVPIPPLDGSRLLYELLPADLAWKYRNTVDRFGMFILIALVFTGVVSSFITPLANIYLRLVNFIVHLIF